MKHKIITILFGLLLVARSPFLHTEGEFDSGKKKRVLKAIAIGVGCAGGYYLCTKGKPFLMRTRAGFHISRYYNSIRYGSEFTFNQIAGDPIDQDLHDDIRIVYDASGAILAVNDGKKTPLVLGSIPDKQEHIDQLMKAFDNSAKDTTAPKTVGILTLNEDWECDAAGLSELLRTNNYIMQLHYTTPDFTLVVLGKLSYWA